ncbi:MAG TPA: hypothetical protein VFY26_12835 [Anaerolineales bacterium]|nr:hypothetical protein [Anaerolineales bacterium]
MHALIPPREPGSSDPIRPHMVYVEKPLRWEYKQVVRNLESEKPLDESELNALGEDGWELAGVAQHPPFAYCYFKRPAEK